MTISDHASFASLSFMLENVAGAQEFNHLNVKFYYEFQINPDEFYFYCSHVTLRPQVYVCICKLQWTRRENHQRIVNFFVPRPCVWSANLFNGCSCCSINYLQKGKWLPSVKKALLMLKISAVMAQDASFCLFQMWHHVLEIASSKNVRCISKNKNFLAVRKVHLILKSPSILGKRRKD